MRRLGLLVSLLAVLAACGEPQVVGERSTTSELSSATTTTVVSSTTAGGPDQPVGTNVPDETTTSQSATAPGEPSTTVPGPVASLPPPRTRIGSGPLSQVTVEGADIVLMESYPVQVVLEVSGERPTPCHQLTWTIDDDGESINVRLGAEPPGAGQDCVQVIDPFEVSIPLGSFAGVSRDVFLNGELVGSFDS